jgi:hypothetical protein
MSSVNEILKKFAELVSESGWEASSVQFNAVPELMQALLQIEKNILSGEDEGDTIFLAYHVSNTLEQVDPLAYKYFNALLENAKKIAQLDQSSYWMKKKIGEMVDYHARENPDFSYNPPARETQEEKKEEELGRFDRYYEDEYSKE